jgi:nitrite reductase (NADH) small subunit
MNEPDGGGARSPKRKHSKRLVACKVAELPLGTRKILDLAGKSIGIFNVDGKLFALHNRCPHMGGALCQGPWTGTALPSEKFTFTYGLEGHIIRCGWHGWEFEIETGQALVDPKLRARTYPVAVEGEDVVVYV